MLLYLWVGSARPASVLLVLAVCFSKDLPRRDAHSGAFRILKTKACWQGLLAAASGEISIASELPCCRQINGFPAPSIRTGLSGTARTDSTTKRFPGHFRVIA